MGSRKKQLPPLRDSKLTHLLAAALGDSTALVHALVYAPTQRQHQAEAAAALEWAAKASAARLKPGVYAGTPSKGLVTQLQAVLNALDSPGEEMRQEMHGQMTPDEAALERLREEVATPRPTPTTTPTPTPTPSPTRTCTRTRTRTRTRTPNPTPNSCHLRLATR